MESACDLTLQLYPSVNNDLFFPFFFFVIAVDHETECAGATESIDVLYVSVRLACMIKLNIEENFKIWMLSFLGKSRYYLT